MKTLKVSNGDLVLEGGRYTEVSGPTKVVQDMGLAFVEPFGSDPYHTLWGSLFETFVGRPATDGRQMQIRAEAARVVGNYVTVQSATIRADTNAGVKPRFEINEIIAGVGSTDIRQDQDKFVVKVALVALGGDALPLVVGFS